jgi:hypothetical protein
MDVPTAEGDAAKTINWAITAIGTFTCSWALLAWVRTTGQRVKLPIFDELTVTETVIFSIPLVFFCLILLYFLAVKHNHIVRPSRRLERIPPAYTLPLVGEMACFRLAVLLMFFVLPTASLVRFLNLFVGLEIISMVDGSTLRAQKIFSFPERWYDGELWRWITDNPAIRPSAFPGAQPYCYTVLVVTAVIVLVVFIGLIFRRQDRPRLARPLLRRRIAR